MAILDTEIKEACVHLQTVTFVSTNYSVWKKRVGTAWYKSHMTVDATC